MTILFSCSGRRNYLLSYFRQSLDKNDKIFAVDMDATAPSLQIADKAFLVPGIYENNYFEKLLEICRKEKVDALISLNDLELPMLAINKERFKQIGTQVIVSSPEVIDICFDKIKTSLFLNQINLQTPKQYLSIESALNAIKESELSFPLVIKPRWGSASIGIEFPESIEELQYAYGLLQFKIRRSILKNVSSKDYDNSILIQELIKGKEYGLDIINDLDGNNMAVIIKEKLGMRAGETDKAKTVYDRRLINIGRLIGNELKHVANLDVDLFVYDNQISVLEMNPRFGGGYPFSHMSGVRLPEAIINWLKGERASLDALKLRYGDIYAKYDDLIKINTDNSIIQNY